MTCGAAIDREALFNQAQQASFPLIAFTAHNGMPCQIGGPAWQIIIMTACSCVLEQLQAELTKLLASELHWPLYFISDLKLHGNN